MKKRLANLLVALVTMVTGMFVPATAFADPDQTPGANAEEWTEVSTWADLAAALRAGGTVLLTQDVTAGEDDSVLTVPSGVTVTLDLNGHTIDRAAASVTIDGILRATGTDGDVIRVNGGTLTVLDGSAEGTGAITGGCHNYGGGVYVLNGGAFTLAGGSIRGNTATQRTNSVSSNVGGGGVMVIGSGSSFTMTGGKIAENVSTTTFGGAVYLESHASFTMTGGEISGNTAKLSGAVYMVGGSTFTMTGGTITGNAATDSGKTFGGGGVSVKDGSTFTMSGGTISNNTTYGGRGPGVYVQNGVFTMEDGEISGNRATASAVYGGGVAVYPNTDGESASFTMNGGTISGNGSGYGAGVAVYGSNASFAMNGGTITGNDAGISTYGSGVYVASGAGFSVSGLVNIRGNTQGEAERNVILLGAIGSAPLITIAGPVDPNSSIGVYNYFTSSSAIQITNGLNGEDFGFLYADNGSYMFDRHTDGLEAALYKVEMYSVSVKTPVNGTLAADKTQAKAGTRICLTLTPEPAYRVDHVYYKPENQNEREINPVNGVYSFSMPDKDVIVRAVFSVIKLNVGLNPGEGGGVASSTQIQPANGIYTYTLPACPFTAPENKFFDGWGLDGSSYQPGDTVTLTEDCVFTAQWRSAVVHFDANGGTGVMADALCGTSYTLPDCAFTAPKGKLFTGWLVDDTVEQPGTVISVDSSITVTAQWTTAYTISRVSNGFKITRAITGSAETVAYRTVSQSAIAGVHFNAASGTASFNAEDDATIVTVAELAAGDNINFYYLNGSAKRSYRFEVLSTGNKEVLASYNREIDFNTSYKVPSSGAYDAKTVTVKSGETTITDDGYDNNSPISYALSGYYALVAPQNYYRLTGAELHMTLSFSAKEVDDGYQYLSVLTSATAYDNRSGCSNGDPGNIGNSRYMLGFEHSKGGKNTSYASYTMPLTGYGSNCGAAADPWGNGVGYLSTQKFNTGCRASDGRLVFPASASTLVLRGNASGDSDDDWVIKNIQANIQAVDTTAPVVNDVVVTQGTYGLGDTVTVALRFSEVVKVGSSSSVYLTTSFGKMEYKGGSGLNTLYFSRTLDTSSLAGALQISSVKLSGCADLAGKACTQTSLATSSFANVVYEGYNTITVNHNNEATGPDTVYYRKHTPYVLEEPACEAPVGKEFDCYQVGSVQYQPGESFTPEAAATAVDIVWKWQMMPVTFYDEDGETVLYTGSFQYGLSPEYPGDENVAPALEKACDAGYHYSFAGWTDGEQTYADELPAVTEPAVYAAVYASEAHDWGAPSYSWSENEGSWSVTASRVCMVCGRTETEDGAVTSEITRAATCLELGETTYTGTFASESFATQVKAETDIPALGHDYVAVVTAPTCTERGYTTHTCSRCQNSYVDTYTDALGHDFGEWTLTTAPTCTEAGEETRHCSRCDATETRPVNALGHDYVAVVTAPTCTERGYTTHTCSRCQDSYVDTHTDALAHDFGEWILTLAPTCTDAGVETRTCSRCDATETRPVNALGHVWEEPVWTWTYEDGNATATATFTCSRCGVSETVDGTVSFTGCYIASALLDGNYSTDRYYPPVRQGATDLTYSNGISCLMYTFTPETDGFYRFASTGDLDTSIMLELDVDDSGTWTFVAGNDDSGVDSNFSVIVSLEAGAEYILSITSRSSGEATLTIESVNSYGITVPDTAASHGEVLVFDFKTGHELSTAATGELVYLRYEAEGDDVVYGVREWTVTNDDTGEEVPVAFDGEYGYYYFVMPDAPVTVSASVERMYRCSFQNNNPNMYAAQVEANGIRVSVSGSYEHAYIYAFSGDEIGLFYLSSDPHKGLAALNVQTAAGETVAADTPVLADLDGNTCWRAAFTMPAADVTIDQAAGKAAYPTLSLGSNDMPASTVPVLYWFAAETSGKYTFSCEGGGNVRLYCYDMDAVDDGNTYEMGAGACYLYAWTSDSDAVLTIERTGDAVTYDIAIPTAENGSVSAISTSVPAGATVALTATPDDGYRSMYVLVKSGGEYLNVWSSDGDERLTGAPAEYTFTMPEGDVTVEAAFAPRKYRIEFVDGSYQLDTMYLELGETPDTREMEMETWYESASSGAPFIGWEPEIGPVTGDTVYTMVYGEASPERYHISATDEAITASLFISPPLGDSVTDSDTYAGLKVVLSARVEDGKGIESWSVIDADGYPVALDTDEYGFPCFTMPESDVTVSVTYTDNVLPVHLSDGLENLIGSDVNGALLTSLSGTPREPYAAPGETVTMLFVDSNNTGITVTVTPTAGEPFTVSSVPASAVVMNMQFGIISFTMPDSPVSVSAEQQSSHVDLPELALGINEIDNRQQWYSFTPAKTGAYSFKALDDNGWRAYVYDEDGNEVDSFSSDSPAATLVAGERYLLQFNVNSYSLSLTYIMIEEPSEEAVLYPITVEEVLHGRVVPTVDEAPEGYQVTLTFIPDPGYRLSGVSPEVTCSGVSLDLVACNRDRYYFNMPAGAVTVAPPEFVPVDYALTVEAEMGTATALVNGEPAETAHCGDTVVLEMEPDDSSFPVPNVYVNGVHLKAQDGAYSFIMPAGDVTINASFSVPHIETPAFTDPEGRAIEDQALVEWLSENNFTQSDINALGSDAAATDKLYECWLLNCSITAANPGGALSITGFAVSNDVVSVTVQLVRQSPLGFIKGVLYLYGADDLSVGFGDRPISEEIINFRDGDSTFAVDSATVQASGTVTQTVTATFDTSIVTETFFKAKIEFPRSDEPDEPWEPDPEEPEEEPQG